MTVAAAIQFEFVTGKDDAPPLAGVQRRLLALRTLDGVDLDAALFQPERKAAADTTLLIMVHGSGSAWRQQPTIGCAHGVSREGYAALAINTRQHEDGVNLDDFMTIRHDIEAAVATGRALGYTSIILQGHSLGNIQMAFFAATHWDRDLRGVILLGPFANLPWKSRHLLIGDEGRYRDLTRAARTALSENRAAEVLPIGMSSYAGGEVPVSAQHFLTYRSTATSVADGTFWISRIPRPILIVRDEADAVIQFFEPQMLYAAATADGALSPSVEKVAIANERPLSRAAHSFTDTIPDLVRTIVTWLRSNGC